ncbi:MAG: KpsF/GutQ family sugar-phosphate isomerase [Betaproteobacteria bacterium]|nr:KpsF/GutQ family sugar-phosphate isomerase [Betaproteobacteria bacterium]MDE2132197.1 KpsF/GutQ family sugar-phosphate isomerase [Betaproteobacteria bacterium]MDE2212272.1 KpsF/GutQ family sugar-phosphate isomerase [Betaproteobacteria bacterium]
MNDATLLDLARNVLSIESEAIDQLSLRLDGSFVAAHHLMRACQGRIVVSGIGKSGHVGNKIASTLASTGTPAFFMHPAEASHGDLGMIAAEDLLLALSNSGESEELLIIVPLLKRRGTRLVAITGNPQSRLARLADVHLDASVPREACPLNLAPTASTTAVLALGDALAVTLLEAKGFSAADFARTHPGGSLGKRLLLMVQDIMHQDPRVPRVGTDATVAQALAEMSDKALGMTAVVDGQGRLLGIFTDGDLRRALEKGQTAIHDIKVRDLMTANPVVTRADALAAEAAATMQERKIFGLFVVDADGKLVGAFNMHDLLRAGIV